MNSCCDECRQAIEPSGVWRSLARLGCGLNSRSVDEDRLNLWLVQLMVLTVAPDAPSVNGTVHNYGQTAFVATQLPGSQIDKWLADRKGEIAGLDFELPELNEQVRSERFPSHARYRGFDGSWQPHPHYELYAKSSRFEPPSERVPLVAREVCCSFSKFLFTLSEVLINFTLVRQIERDRAMHLLQSQ